MQERLVRSLIGKITWRRQRQSTPVFLPRKSRGQRSLTGYSPWGHKESDMTENVHTSYQWLWYASHSSSIWWEFYWCYPVHVSPFYIEFIFSFPRSISRGAQFLPSRSEVSSSQLLFLTWTVLWLVSTNRIVAEVKWLKKPCGFHSFPLETLLLPWKEPRLLLGEATWKRTYFVPTDSPR